MGTPTPDERPDLQPDDRPGGSRDAPAVSVRVPRRSAARVVWFVSLVVAFGLGWFASRQVPPLLEGRHDPPAVERQPVAEPPVTADATPPAEPEPEQEPAAVDVPEPEPRPEPAPRAERRAASPPARPQPEPAEPEAIPIATAPGPVATADPTAERARRADRLADDGDADGASALAGALIAEYGSYTGLTEALTDDGMGDVESRLAAVRVVQLAGHDDIAVELARELKRSYLGTDAVAESIGEWGLLTPRITAVETAIETDRRILVTGTVDNPDIGEIRRVTVEVAALDAGGSVLGVETTRVRPRSLAAGEAGTFVVRIKGVDTAAVLRTRATVLEWESEVLLPPG